MSKQPFGQPQFRHLGMLERRLARLERMRVDYDGDLNHIGLRLIDRAIHATRQDLQEWPAEVQR